jgi:hypothetical protein
MCDSGRLTIIQVRGASRSSRANALMRWMMLHYASSPRSSSSPSSNILHRLPFASTILSTNGSTINAANWASISPRNQFWIKVDSLNNIVAIRLDPRGQLVGNGIEEAIRVVTLVRARDEYRCSEGFGFGKIPSKCLDDG